MSSEGNVIQRLGDANWDDDGEEYEDYDSGAGSDDFDLLELGQINEEFCQIGDQICCIPIELYDLPGLGDILSLEAWNGVLTEKDRFVLAKYLPDMDRETFMRTMKELFTGCNFHFGVPIIKLFEMLKGGLCEPRVALYRQGLGFFQKQRHYHAVKMHQNMMVDSLIHVRDVWMKCREYSIEEKLQVLDILKSQKSLMYEEEEQETDSSDWEEYGDGSQSKKKLKGHYPGYRLSPTFDFHTGGKQLALESANYGKHNPKGTLKVLGSKMALTKESGGRFPSVNRSLDTKSGPYVSGSVLPRPTRVQFRGEVEEERMYEVTVHQDHKGGKKFEGLRSEDCPETFMGLPLPSETRCMPLVGIGL